MIMNTWPHVPPPAVSAAVVHNRLRQVVACNQLSAFYSEQQLAALAQGIAARVDFHALAARWRAAARSARGGPGRARAV
jgi:hypothetical protein